MNAKVEEQKKLLTEYQAHSYYYGRQGHFYQSHHQALLHEYEKAAELNREMAASQRRMAKEIK